MLSITAFTVAPAAANAPAARGSSTPSAVMRCQPAAGTVISSRATSSKVAWLPTSVSSSFLAGPGTISRSSSKESTVGLSVSASFELDESLLFASAKETYGVTLSGSISNTQTWTYSKSVPKGVTAKVQQYHEGREIGIRQRREEVSATTHCHVAIEKSLTGNFFPLHSTADDTYCYALTTSKNPGIQARKLCKNKT